jgi:hypothetical protein
LRSELGFEQKTYEPKDVLADDPANNYERDVNDPDPVRTARAASAWISAWLP